MINLSSMNIRSKQRGAVSLFVVVFAALLITVVTVSFVRIMIQDQQQATAVDLSQSAYDSAQAGVEDAKRALIRYQAICQESDEAACASAKATLDSATCNTAVKQLSEYKDNTSSEIIVQEGNQSNALDQAYTCIKIALDTIDYLGTLAIGDSKIIPLRVNSGSDFDTVKIEWFSGSDLPAGPDAKVDLQAPSPNMPLLPQSGSGQWQPNRPSIMRIQLIQIGSNGFNLGDFDSVNSDNESNANTLFLYPTGISGSTAPVAGTTVGFIGNDIRRSQDSTPMVPVNCLGSLAGGGYACSATIKLPGPINGGEREAYLRVNSLYNKASYRVTMFSSDASPVKFDAVQPEIDSTGRANDLFRRVKVRVELSDINFPYPDAAVEVTGNFCKTFSVTDNPDDYKDGGCKP